MSDQPATSPPAAAEAGRRGDGYIVVARRYRPQTFAELIGQEHVGRALSNAIATQRVGHAYLFTGARGVGKTSAARILAKALNCAEGPTPAPCNRCDLCESVASGDDVDVLEIDGASNRGIDEIRQLRQTINVRPSRARFKIYIIDEVHMLTREAFNALLKTLEEPPEHVKFLFCTTEPAKLPITILSRCQRFDFAGIDSQSIARRLVQIVESEGVTAEAEALDLLARRAAGSMRDSQSLLEQLLAFAPERISVADVHQMLGSAGDEHLAVLVEKLIDRDAAGALAWLGEALAGGADAAQLGEQLFGYLRDLMAAAAGCPASALRCTMPSVHPQVLAAGPRWGLATVLAAMQILDQSLARMRYSTQPRLLAELALVRISQLEELDDLAELIARGGDGAPSAAPPRSPRGTAPGTTPPHQGPPPATASPPNPRAQERPEEAKPPGHHPSGNPPAHDTPSSGDAEVAARPEGVSLLASFTSATTVAASTAATGGAEAAETLVAPDGCHRGGGPAHKGEAELVDGATRRHEAESHDAAGVQDRPPRGAESEAASPPDDGGQGEMPGDLTAVWREAVSRLTGLAAEHARSVETVRMAAPGRLVAEFAPGYTFSKKFCEQPAELGKLERALRDVCGRAVRVELSVRAGEEGAVVTPPPRAAPAQQRLQEVADHPLIRRAAELFGAQPLHVEDRLSREDSCSKV